jgi:cytochrome oxidase Cu insertion factor (SCO1/SenC/PrrC family)
MADPILSDEERRAAFGRGPFRFSRRTIWVAAGVAVVISVVGAVLGVVAPDGGGPNNAQPTPSAGQVPAISSSLAAFMGLSALSAKLAPDFTLTDQKGRILSLRSFRGKVVILSFMDDLCGALCPVLDEELADASRDLGTDGSQVAFVAINVDAAEDTVTEVDAYSSAHGLTAIPSWRFLTGDATQLATAWDDYGVSVEPETQRAAVIYTPAIYFLGPTGNEVYEATPFANELPNGTGTLPAASVTRYGSGIAAYALRLLSKDS